MSEHALSLHVEPESAKWAEVCRNGPLSVEDVTRKMASGHSVYSPSGSEMSMTCAESLYLNALSEDYTSYEAAEGTVAHMLSEEWIKTGSRPDDLVGRCFDQAGHQIEITEEMLGFVGDFVGLCAEHGEAADLQESEKHVDVSHLTPIPGQGGTMDFVAISPNHLTVIDLKYGKERVEACYFDDDGNLQINKQLGVYASGVFREWDWLYDFQTIEIIISQPRLPNPISTATITRQELLAFDTFAKTQWALTWKPREQLTRTPSVKGCRWCSERSRCSALYLFLSESTDVFSTWEDSDNKQLTYENERLEGANDLILDPLAISPFPKTPDPRSLSTKAMAKLLRYRKLMENFFNAIEHELLDRAISSGEDIPWWKLVEGRSNRVLIDEDDLVVQALQEYGFSSRDLYRSVRLSPAQLEAAVHTTINKGKKRGDKDRVSLGKVKSLLEEKGLTVKPPGQKTLAPRGDTRPELPKDGDVFQSWDA